MKKGMMIVGMISLILVVVLVSGVKTEKEYPGTTINAEFILQDYEFKKGWNLVQGILNPEWIESNSENIKAIYAFNPKSKEYVRFFPEAERDKIGGTNYAWHSFATIGALWVYSDKEFNSKYWKFEDFPLENTELFSGWNFVAITQEMVGKTIQDITSSCDLEKAYFWNADVRGQSGWSEIGQTNNRVDLENVGTGFVIRVTSDCNLGSSGSGGSPPGLPADNNQIEFPNELGDYVLEDREIGNYACAPANQFGPSLGIQIDDEICIEGSSFEYLNKNDDLSDQRGIRLTLAKFSKGKEAYKNTIISYLSPTETEYIYGSGEPWELYWWSGDNYIALQVFVKHPTDSGYSNSYPNTATVEHLVIKWFLNEYPPTE